DGASTKLTLDTMGLKTSGLLSSIILPSVLTLLLYFGSFVLMYIEGSLWHFISIQQWSSAMGNLRWIRNSIVAPITEEIAFRSCSAALVLQCFDWKSTVFIAPLFFSLSHFHHVLDQTKQGALMKHAILGCAFQAVYTYLFGIYATFLFLRTGLTLFHVLARISHFDRLQN
uniref:CAAX prenyl protease 2 n=1 Tax=Plectus sambesii TaxID=2011161 RepID=A0A914WS29_9BILA